MARKKRNHGDGHGLTTFAFAEAYKDAAYAVMLQTVEEILKDPKRRDVIRRLTIELLESVLQGLKERTSPP